MEGGLSDQILESSWEDNWIDYVTKPSAYIFAANTNGSALLRSVVPKGASMPENSSLTGSSSLFDNFPSTGSSASGSSSSTGSYSATGNSSAIGSSSGIGSSSSNVKEFSFSTTKCH
jgi:hypothetical protein